MERKYIKKPKWKIALYKNTFQWWPKIYVHRLTWKDKYGPVVQSIPTINIIWLIYHIYIYRGDVNHWERYLWIHKFNDGDEEQAKKTWPWKQDSFNIEKTKISTWDMKEQKYILLNISDSHSSLLYQKLASEELNIKINMLQDNTNLFWIYCIYSISDNELGRAKIIKETYKVCDTYQEFIKQIKLCQEVNGTTNKIS